MKAYYFRHLLKFKTPSGTSRGVLKNKPTWYIKIYLDDNPNIFGLGECGPIEGLSIESSDEMMSQLKKVQNSINDLSSLDLTLFPSIQFGIENALKDLKNGGKRIVFKNSFFEGKPIKINGLIWMGNKDFMVNQIKSKIEKGKWRGRGFGSFCSWRMSNNFDFLTNEIAEKRYREKSSN